MPVIGHCSFGLRRLSNLENFLGAECRYVALKPDRSITMMAGWGLKKSALKAQRLATHLSLPYISIEDGFLRSLGLGVNGAEPHSLVVDSTGIYYDASRPSDLETLIREADFSLDDLARAEKGLKLIRESRLSKYNQSADISLEILPGQKSILVVDQTFGDISVKGGLASEQHFSQMLESAINENPDAEILVKIHPDVVAGKKRGYLKELAELRGCRIISEDISPWSILDGVEKVYVVSSQLGFEALVAGKEVHCFGVPFYAGWGLTRDRGKCGRRSVKRTLLQVFCAAYLKYSRYINPYTGNRCNFEDTVALIAEQRRQWNRFDGDWVGVGFSHWKRSFIPGFIGGKGRIKFSSAKVPDARAGTNVLIWASRITDGLLDEAKKSDLNVWRVEDGFLRSVGLGADLVVPNSLVLDSRGIYFDARQPSDLEMLLNTCSFPDPLLDRARRLREKLIDKGISKYNVVEDKPTVDFGFSSGKKIILVPGQVESDASIANGSPIIKSNLALLERVRLNNPDSHIIYKPHPDVVCGARLGTLQGSSDSLYDTLLEQGDIVSAIKVADEIHTMSSLSGFEALLRGKQVVTYGLPFYAGWGLTRDTLVEDREIPTGELRDFTSRRQRNLTLNQMIAATLLLYPVYVDPKTTEFINAETTIELLEKARSLENKKGVCFKLFSLYRRIFMRY
ncbi:capsular polysaccharide biosynthesis protein [Microbulbifer sp. PAAF003]|uniref:capsular polysaccharide biosynthesis protein n=1 Tax=Microbulbifer sp. PAAF003 TaxID=3243375 RepID=UPI0040395F91